MNKCKDRLQKQIRFIIEVDKIKSIFRKTRLFDNSRFENDAEHSWHLAIMALLLHEYSNEEIDLLKVVKMVLIHDIVEIDAGDTFLYDEEHSQSKKQREEESAERIFGLLEPDQNDEFIQIWKEFEDRLTPEAKFAAALDRLEPLLQNYLTEGCTWKKHNIQKSQVLKKNKPIVFEGSEILWEFINDMIEDAVLKGYLQDIKI